MNVRFAEAPTEIIQDESFPEAEVRTETERLDAIFHHVIDLLAALSMSFMRGHLGPAMIRGFARRRPSNTEVRVDGSKPGRDAGADRGSESNRVCRS
jgi:hypothetical protein